MTTDSTTNDNPTNDNTTNDGATNDAAAAPVASPVAPDGPACRPRRGGARFGTILWGVLLLVFAGAMAVSALPMFSVDTTTLLLAACIAAGVLLVVAGIVAALSRTRR
ncbi:hypothetical protein [Curtobacterium flaccumfaciens]|uniref:hypothetical protein n=1 Tax=Curtobacterium flaccumfaciens TaxID=2035 RepID=UPI001BDEDF9A|nr:hypothetical protein [Curtobacterium flaccumfaciens]MBT1608513.1 hypothetical protein [Curtobacterium flaccumfaciens pv. betae]MBT1658412.1 hypothetical protein [Curtobacterium flaccumfaciens pv. betae]MCS0471207.1 hypothetical protein [Curtobacterium flaccumfaciens pv. betae]MCS0474030.1 hypothetical protein [Curtobacterium flaccumfaciens pv. betae]MCS0477663.1 hypothetical protein [Curtobacterium flaccumfaciens pv. betae]